MDRQRLAQALAYKQAEEERRRQMMESVPTIDDTPAQDPRLSPRGRLENLSIGLGTGITNQLEGLKSIVTDPIGTGKAVYEAGKEIYRNPAMLAEMLREMGQKATSGPLGAGEVIGDFISPTRGAGRRPDIAELDVYQGSPYRFEPTPNNPLGELDSSKIGTGEGAQAYGYGHYLAESQGVGEGYRDALSASKPSQASLIRMRDQEPAGSEVWNYYDKLAKQRVASLYKADLPDEMIDRMLDWDKPLSEQRELATPILKELGYLRPNDNGPRQFAEAVKALSLEHGGFGESGATGMGLFNAIYKGLQQGKPKAIDLAKRMNLTEQEMFMEASPLASEVMKRMGIPGIKYLDAGSRGQGGAGTRNFVVFPGEEKKVRILERDGQKAPPQKIAQALEATAQKTTAVEVPDVLHGSPMRGLTNLSPSKSMEVRGATWFSDNPDVADQYTFPREYGEILYDAEPGEVYKAGLSFKNPMTVDMEGRVGDATELSKLVKKAKEEGYDGLILRNVDDSVDSSKLLGTSYAVFDPSQIKLKKK